MIDVGDAPLEFESRRKQGVRAGQAWQAVGALDPEFVVHMGDLVQEFPGRPDYERAVTEALSQIDEAGVADRCHFVVGNHDIGDKPDPTMPTRPVTDAELDGWHGRYGSSWHEWSAGGVTFLAVNSQILNTSLPAAAEQRTWFEQRCDALQDTPCVLFIHLPPYLHDPDEAHLGHYDNVGEPDRTWLLDLVRRHNVHAMFTAHVHFQFYDHVPGAATPCRYRVTPSPAFTRPGFSHLFTGAAPNEQGRDDVDKLGFFYCRQPRGAGPQRLDVHRVRMTGLPGPDEAALLTPPTEPGPPEADGFCLGVTLRHPLAPTVQVPIAWPSVVRQPVRNDYPLLSCVDLGARRVRVPAADLADPSQARRLAVLRADGVHLQAMALGEEEAVQSLSTLSDADSLEVQLPGRLLPDIDRLRPVLDAGMPLVLATVQPGETVAGKQHKRTRIGYRAGELDELATAMAGVDVDWTAAVRLDGTAPWDEVAPLTSAPCPIQLLCESPGTDEATNLAALCRAVVAAASLNVPLHLEPFVDMDRTMDAFHGLLDPLCNPRPAFDAVRSLGALLTAQASANPSLQVSADGRCVSLGDSHLLLPDGATALGQLAPAAAAGLSVCRLAGAAVAPFDPDRTVDAATGPLLVYPEATG